MIDNINNIPNVTMNTIIAANASNIAVLANAPIRIPNAIANIANIITITINKHPLFLQLFLLFLLS